MGENEVNKYEEEQFVHDKGPSGDMLEVSSLDKCFYIRATDELLVAFCEVEFAILGIDFSCVAKNAHFNVQIQRWIEAYTAVATQIDVQEAVLVLAH